MTRTVENARLEATKLLMKFLDPALVAERLAMVLALRPAPEDYARVFVPEIADTVRTSYENVWRTAPLWRIRPDQTYLKVSAATVEELQGGGGQTMAFPGGYRDVAPFFAPGFIWVAWEFMAPSAVGGMSFDGLVPVGDRWAWFPKPWRVVPVAAIQRVASQWAD